MRFQTAFDLVLSYVLCGYIINSSGLKLENNGYRDLLIAIHPGIQYNDKIIKNIQEIMTEASSYLHRATKQQVYFSDVKILLPQTWPVSASSVHRPTTESYEKAKVIIAEPYLKYGDDPYTLQYGGCGEKGRYIHLTPNFILNSLIPVFASKGRVFVHEWAQLQWGVFEEYNDLEPFYISDDRIPEATRCSKEITGKIVECPGSNCFLCDNDFNTGLPIGDCKFFPEKNQSSFSSIMYLQGLPSVVEFCDNETHNPEAPNMQNKMCDHRSTWDVIKESEDFRSNRPPHIGPVTPTFTILQAKDRVLCLVLDTSGSMGSENRINRLRQAAEIFLLQIIEVQSQVGVVTFDSAASIQADLKVIDDENVRDQLVRLLPTSAKGGTNICAGVQSGFRVLRGDDGATNGDEIVLLTDGEDSGISSCFAEVEQSGSVIHTIALGPSAAVELEQLSKMTGGLQFAATDNMGTNGLIDSFTGLVSGNGDISKQAIQLESSGRRIDDHSWLNSTVFIDKTVGSNTFFVITWEAQTPDMFVHDPNGKTYNSGDFGIDKIGHTARFKINGIALTGPWKYSILNPGTKQAIAITVTSRAADEKVPPITVNAYINRKDSTSPMIIYAEVSQGFSPVLFVTVTAIIECPAGPPVEQNLSDDGLGADIVKNDGIYTKYFQNFNGHGRYSLKVHVHGKAATVKMAGKPSLYIPGFIENDNIHPNQPRPPINTDNPDPKLGDISRAKAGGTISVPIRLPTVDFPPCKIRDLRATIVQNKVQLEWTAPGEDYDQGTASYYEMRMSGRLLQLRDDFSNAKLVNLTNLTPQPYGSRETVTIILQDTTLQNWTNIYFAVRAYDKIKQSSVTSNIAKVSSTFFVPLIEHRKGLSRSGKTWIAVAVTTIVFLTTGTMFFILCKRRRKRKNMDE
ncbi:calcium-activated chloride channel regulator 1-like [Carcharodon carcharias]|uniref:calcium-activated chloride channel regulator 1-like n=1 Tax=Carcharodon carcharias TaxID=13397 RepID=UPI001B7DB913|nr:calcium-activated chloride channel regulator 1-like [Carcharodon carcharias]